MICLAWLSWSFPHLRASKLTRKCCSISPVTCCIPTLDICSHISTRTRSLGSILSVESELDFYEVWPVDWWSNKDGKFDENTLCICQTISFRMANRSIHQRRQTHSILPATGESVCPARGKEADQSDQRSKQWKAEHPAGPSSTLADAESWITGVCCIHLWQGNPRFGFQHISATIKSVI